MAGRTWPSGNKSYAMLASTSLAFVDIDATLQVTTTEHGDVFLSAIVGNEAGARLHLRIPAAEWQHMIDFTRR